MDATRPMLREWARAAHRAHTFLQSPVAVHPRATSGDPHGERHPRRESPTAGDPHGWRPPRREAPLSWQRIQSSFFVNNCFSSAPFFMRDHSSALAPTAHLAADRNARRSWQRPKKVVRASTVMMHVVAHAWSCSPSGWLPGGWSRDRRRRANMPLRAAALRASTVAKPSSRGGGALTHTHTHYTHIRTNQTNKQPHNQTNNQPNEQTHTQTNNTRVHTRTRARLSSSSACRA